MATQEITVRLPAETLQGLDQLAERKRTTRDDVLVELIRGHLQRKEWEREIAKLTFSHLGRKRRPGRPISEIQINAEKVAAAMAETYGTDDIVEIINMSRWRGGSL